MDDSNINKFTSFDDYFSSFPENTRKKLEQIRTIVKEVVPEAQETISYNMPAYKFHGILLYFAAHNEHIGFYPGDAKTLTVFQNQIEGFETSKGTIRFPLDKPLPLSLIRTIIQFRANTNSEKFSQKQKKKT
jgi:uncharacterized protein YdhG (YjbR/CyaY superfamily)